LDSGRAKQSIHGRGRDMI
jgi:hypothetical protein